MIMFGLALFIVGLIWWLVGLVIAFKKHDMGHMLIGLMVLNLGNVILQLVSWS